MFMCFDIIHERDRQTDRQTDGRTDTARRHRLTAYAYRVPDACLVNRASAYGTPLDGATVKVVITTVNKT